eukprot:991744-Pelagomonas_calceolata.AAC.6
MPNYIMDSSLKLNCLCPDTNPISTLEAATAQHASTITRLKTCSSRKTNRNSKVCVCARNETVALGHKDQAKTGGRMPL